MAGAIEMMFSDVKVEGNPKAPRPSAFEVSSAKGTLFYSKLEKGAFPDNKKLLEEMKASGEFTLA